MNILVLAGDIPFGFFFPSARRGLISNLAPKSLKLFSLVRKEVKELGNFLLLQLLPLERKLYSTLPLFLYQLNEAHINKTECLA